MSPLCRVAQLIEGHPKSERYIFESLKSLVAGAFTGYVLIPSLAPKTRHRGSLFLSWTAILGYDRYECFFPKRRLAELFARIKLSSAASTHSQLPHVSNTGGAALYLRTPFHCQRWLPRLSPQPISRKAQVWLSCSKHFQTPLFSRFGPTLLPISVFLEPQMPDEGTKRLSPRIFALRHLVYMKSVRLIIWWVTRDRVLFKSSTQVLSLASSFVVDQIIQTFLQKFSFPTIHSLY